MPTASIQLSDLATSLTNRLLDEGARVHEENSPKSCVSTMIPDEVDSPKSAMSEEKHFSPKSDNSTCEPTVSESPLSSNGSEAREEKSEKDAEPAYDPKQFLNKNHPVTFNQVVRKLNTKEDVMYLHKIFGVLALMSFFYRYLIVWPTTGTLGFDNLNFLNVGTILVHTLLSCSAIIFKVPLKRILKQPTMIWHEYRLHAIVFTLRCTSVFALSAMTQDIVSTEVSETRARSDVVWSQVVRCAAVLFWHAAADLITHVYGESGQTTVRGREDRKTKSPMIRNVMKAYASYQLIALASHLVPSARAMDMGYNTLIAIQSSAFLMTLNRKNLIRWQSHMVGYGISLVLSATFILTAMSSWVFTISTFMAATARMEFRVSKYLIWVTFALCHGLGVFGAVLYCVLFAAAGYWAHLNGKKAEEPRVYSKDLMLKVKSVCAFVYTRAELLKTYPQRKESAAAKDASEKAAYDKVCQETIENLH